MHVFRHHPDSQQRYSSAEVSLGIRLGLENPPTHKVLSCFIYIYNVCRILSQCECAAVSQVARNIMDVIMGMLLGGVRTSNFTATAFAVVDDPLSGQRQIAHADYASCRMGASAYMPEQKESTVPPTGKCTMQLRLTCLLALRLSMSTWQLHFACKTWHSSQIAWRLLVAWPPSHIWLARESSIIANLCRA